jgi:hypothetical protein
LSRIITGVFLTVGDHDEDELGGPVVLHDVGHAVLDVVDAAPDRIQQRRGGAGDESLARERRHLLHPGEAVEDLVGILGIELHQGEGGFPRQPPLLVQEGVEPADDFVPDGLHGPGAVEDDGDVGVVRLHAVSPS